MTDNTYSADDDEGYTDDAYYEGSENYKYYPYVIGLQEMSDGTKIARVYIEVSFDVKLQYKYLDEDRSYWDKEERKYLWTAYTEKVCKFRASTEFSASIGVDDSKPYFNDFIDMPEEIDVGEEEFLEIISKKEK